MHVITPTDGPEGSADQRVWRWSDEPTSVCQVRSRAGGDRCPSSRRPRFNILRTPGPDHRRCSLEVTGMRAIAVVWGDRYYARTGRSDTSMNSPGRR
jgi:hypothetical protein